jgi:hypothetical protein
MTDDIVTRLREIQRDAILMWYEKETIDEAVAEIERLRRMLAHGLVFGSRCEGCDICDQLKQFHEQTIDEIIKENQKHV